MTRWSGRHPKGSMDNRNEVFGIDRAEDVYVPEYIPDTPGYRDFFGRFQGAIRYLDTQFGRLL